MCKSLFEEFSVLMKNNFFGERKKWLDEFYQGEMTICNWFLSKCLRSKRTQGNHMCVRLHLGSLKVWDEVAICDPLLCNAIQIL